MKKILFLLIFVIISYSFSQSPQTVNYQGYLTDASDNPISGTIDMNFTIWDAQSGGSQVWTGETINSISVSNGVFNVILGESTAITADFSAQYWLQVIVDPSGDNVTLPRIQLASAGYSLSTKRVEVSDAAGQNLISSINSATTGTIDADRLGTGTTDNTTFLRGDGTWQTQSGGDIAATLTAGNIADDGQTLEIDEVAARDNGGLMLSNDSGNGILIEDDNDVVIGKSSTTNIFEVYSSGQNWNYNQNVSSSVTSSASTELSGYEVNRLFDGDPASDWSTSSGQTTGWVKVDFGVGNSEVIIEYTMLAYTGSDNDWNPDDWTFEGSNDNSNWDVLDTQTDQFDVLNHDVDNPITYTFSNSTAYRYYKMDITSNGGDAQYLGFHELTLYAEKSVSNPSLYVSSSGKVGIGTVSPSEALHVEGNILAEGSVSQYSDKRLKENIRLLSDVLGKLQQINAYYYNWKKDNPIINTENKDLGVLAQELETVFPELIHIDNRGYKSVDYNKLSAVLLQAVKEQQLLIDTQNKRINEQDERLNKIESILYNSDK